MTTSVACKAQHVSPPGVQLISDPGSVIVSQSACISSDPNQSLGSEFNLMEMTEVEYTHLQHIIQSHMEAQAAEENGSEEVRISPATCPEGRPPCQPETATGHPAGSPSASTPAPSDVHCALSGSDHDGQVNLQEIKMVLVSDPQCVNVSVGERTPTSCGEVPGSVLAKVRCALEAVQDSGGPAQQELRPNPPARVRLEKRFNSSRCNISRQQDSQSAALNTFLSMLQHNLEAPGIAMLSQSDKWLKPDRISTAGCVYPCGGNLFSTVGPSRGQGLGHLSQLLEGNKHPEVIIPKNFSFSYRPDKATYSMMSAPCSVRPGVVEEQICVKLENEANAPLPVKRGRGRGPKASAPGIAQGSGPWRPGGAAASAPGGRKRGRVALESSQRRERHNSKERDRRRRIRLCCDELNLLVPFCNTETDKATTLQWTAAFLKYIREVFGDKLKEEFQSTFCGKTGMRLRASYMSAMTLAQHGEEHPPCQLTGVAES